VGSPDGPATGGFVTHDGAANGPVDCRTGLPPRPPVSPVVTNLCALAAWRETLLPLWHARTRFSLAKTRRRQGRVARVGRIKPRSGGSDTGRRRLRFA